MFLKEIVISSILLGLLFACNNDDQGFKDFDAGGTATEAIAGEWFVREYEEQGGELIPLSEYYKILISNTAANNANEILVSRIEIDNSIGQQVKATANVQNLTFEALNALNLNNEEERISLIEGKILKDQALAKESKTVVDSISFRFSSTTVIDPVIVGGHRRSGFVEDEVVE